MRKLLVFVAAALTVLAFSISMDDILKASASLNSVSCTIRAENHSRSRVSVVEFFFAFKRKNMMRIEYTYPNNMKGTIVAMDGEYFYNYIPSLNRKMKKKITDSSKNPGKDMGILYHYILGDLGAALKGAKVKFEGEQKIKIGNAEKSAYLFTLTFSDHTERVWFDKQTLFPIKLELYRKGKLYVVLTASDVKINPELDPKLFKPF